MSETPLTLLSQEAIEAAASNEAVFDLENNSVPVAPYLEQEMTMPTYGDQIASVHEAYGQPVPHETFREPRGVETLPYIIAFGRQAVAQRKLAREDDVQYPIAA